MPLTHLSYVLHFRNFDAITNPTTSRDLFCSDWPDVAQQVCDLPLAINEFCTCLDLRTTNWAS
jgi:hypothetical protein